MRQITLDSVVHHWARLRRALHNKWNLLVGPFGASGWQDCLFIGSDAALLQASLLLNSK